MSEDKNEKKTEEEVKVEETEEVFVHVLRNYHHGMGGNFRKGDVKKADKKFVVKILDKFQNDPPFEIVSKEQGRTIIKARQAAEAKKRKKYENKMMTTRRG